MESIDRMPFGQYMDILEVRVKQREHSKAKAKEREEYEKGKNRVELARGTIDALW